MSGVIVMIEMEALQTRSDEISDPEDLYDLIQNRDNEFYLKAPSDLLLMDNKLWISASGLSMDLEELLIRLEGVRVYDQGADEDYSENWLVK